jgi:hypothetical protein
MMKILLSNPENTLGFILPTEEQIVEIGIFDSELIYAQLAALESFNALTPDKVGVSTVTLAAIVDKKGNKVFAMRPLNAKGEAWVMLAPRIEVD